MHVLSGFFAQMIGLFCPTVNRPANPSPVATDESRDGAVIGAFHVRRKDAAGQLVLRPVIGDALAAQPLADTVRVSAGALHFVSLNGTFFAHLFLQNLPMDSSPARPNLVEGRSLV